MSKEEEKKKKIQELEQLYNDASSISGDLKDETNLIAKPNDLVNLQDIEKHDYEGDLVDAQKESQIVIDSMARLYLDDNDKIVNNSYIKKKIHHDSINHADMLFLQKMAKKAIITQLEQMDQGDLTPRHYETFYMGLREVRENIKQATSTQSMMESFYKTIREDLGMSGHIGDINTKDGVEETEEDSLDFNTMDPDTLNAKLDEIMKKRTGEEKKGDK